MRILFKLRSSYVIASLFIGVFSSVERAQSMTIAGDTNSSAPTAIFSLAFTGASFSPDVPVGAGWTNIDLGTFTLSRCPTTSCNENYGTQDGDFDDFILKITFTIPNVLGSPTQIGTDIFGTFGREGLSDEIKNGSSLTIDFDNSIRTLNYNGGPGGSVGHFDIYVDDVAPFGPYTNSGSKFSDENLTRLIVGHIGNLTQEFPSSIPEPSSLMMLFSGLLVLFRSRSVKGSKR